MAKYELCVCTKNNGIKKINIDKFIFKEGDLSSIDKFTMCYTDEESLRRFLFDNELISFENFGDELKIFYTYKGEVKALNVVYKNFSNYLDSKNLLFRIKKKYKDSKFLKRFYKRYKYIKESNIINLYLSDVSANSEVPFYVKLLTDSVITIINQSCTKYNPKTKSYNLYYKGLRDLAMFVYNDDILKNLKHIEKLTKEDLYKAKEEIKTNQKKFLDGQMSLEDIFKSNNDTTSNILNNSLTEIEEDDYEEPLFPPNSEEERMYLEYMENLPDEFCSEEDEDEDNFKYKPYR